LENISKYLKVNFLVSTGKIVVVSLVTLLLLPLIIQRLGLALFGVISLTLLFSEISTIVDLGLSKSIVLLSGEKKIPENRVITSALYINLLIIAILSVIFIGLQLLSVDLLGNTLNISDNDKFILLNTGFIILILTLLNNFCRAILESNYFIHIVNITYTVYMPLLYTVIFVASFFTKNIIFYIITPLFLTLLMLLINFMIIKSKTNVYIVKIKVIHLRYVFKNTVAFLNIGLINSMVIPVLRYGFVLMVADISLYAIFDLSFKIAMLANSLIISISLPMFAVFSKNNKQTKRMINISYKIFGISLAIFISILLVFNFFGNFIIIFLNLNSSNADLLYTITFILLISLGSIAVVEVFYRYFLGNKQLRKAFLLKLIIPVGCLAFFLLFKDVDLVYRFIYAYGASLIISANFILLAFVFQSKTKLQLGK
jgi:hypothetical protein